MLFAFYLRPSSGVGENSGTVLLCSLSVRAPEGMFEGHETYTPLFLLNFHVVLH